MKIRKSTITWIALITGLTANTFAGLNWNIAIAAWIAPIFLLYYSKNVKWPGIIFLFIGMAFSAAISKTAENLSGLFIIYITTGLSYGIINTLPFIIEKLLITRENRFYSTLIFPSSVVCIEYLLSLGIGIWGNPSIAQYNHLDLIQITSLVGIYGISFLVAWLASVVNWMIVNGFEKKCVQKGPVIYVIVFVAIVLYGGIRTRICPPGSETVKVAAVISDTDIHEVFHTWQEDFFELSKDYELEIPDAVFSSTRAIESQIRLTDEALNSGARIVVWNEIALILKQDQRDSLLRRIGKLCEKHNAYVLTAFLEKNHGALPKPFDNKSVLVTPDGEIAWTYLKSYPTPIEKLVINRGEASIPFIDTEYGRVGNAICADIDQPRYMSQAGKNNIDILLVPAFDWEEIIPYHSNMAAFTAVQYGVSLVRSNGKGIVASYDYQGNTLAKANTLLADSKIHLAEIPVKSSSTVYSVIGDSFVYLLILFLLFTLGLRLTGNKKG